MKWNRVETCQRKDHRLPEWHNMCKWIEEMPYFKEICLGE